MRHAPSLFIGETSRGVPRPVFYDSHTPIWNSMPPGTVVTGSPGSGKTFFALTMTMLSTLVGKTTIVIDPKGDFIPLFNLQDELGPVSLWNLGPKGAKSKAGMLDPFYMADEPGDKLTLVISTIDLLCGGLTDAQTTVLAPIVKDVIEHSVPSLQRVVEQLRGSTRETARDLGTKLDMIARMPAARLCFAPGHKRRNAVSIDKGLTIVTLVGMDMPTDAESAAKTINGRLAMTILFLLTDFIRRIMHNDDATSPKSLIIDEAWQVVASEQGASVVKDVALLGRSKNLSLTLVTQSTSHLKNLQLDNTISCRFAFRTDDNEAHVIAKSMGLPPNEGFEGVLTGLRQGECLMQDFRGRTSTVQITSWRKDWAKSFNTNPLEKQEEAKRQREAAAKEGGN